MSAESEDGLILKLILRGQTEAEILDHLQQQQIMDHETVLRVKAKILEAKAAAAFLPRHPPKKRIRLFGLFLIVVAVIAFVIFSDSSLRSTGKYNPVGLALCLFVIGIILVVWPGKGVEKI